MILYRAVDIFFDVIFYLIFIRVIFSWIRVNPYNPIIRFIYQVTDPILMPFQNLMRRLLPPGRGVYIDFSPFIAIIVLQIVRNIVLNIIFTVVY